MDQIARQAEAFDRDCIRGMAPTAFLFKCGRRARLNDGGPREFTYGYAELAAGGAPVEIIEEDELGLDRPWPAPFEKASTAAARLSGVSPRALYFLDAAAERLNRVDHVVATTNTFGFALASLHRLGRLRAHPIIFPMGLIEPGVSALRARWLRTLFRSTTLAALSRAESAFLRSIAGDLDIRDFVFGPDLTFWRPADEPTDDVVLSIGNDWNRDFATLVAAWRPEFPPLTIVTSLPVESAKPNVTVERGDWRAQLISDQALRTRICRARLVVVPVRETMQPSGQSAALQAMACARPVIMSANRGLWDRAQLDRHRACRLVPPGDADALAAAVAQLIADEAEAEAMGARARRMLEVENVSSAAMAEQIARLASASDKSKAAA